MQFQVHENGHLDFNCIHTPSPSGVSGYISSPTGLGFRGINQPPSPSGFRGLNTLYPMPKPDDMTIRIFNQHFCHIPFMAGRWR